MKRGEISIGILIAIVPGIMILTFSIYVLVINKTLLYKKIDNTVSSSTLDDLVLICNGYIDLEQESTYCCESKKLKTEKLNQYITCSQLSEMGISNNRISKLNCEDIIC